MHVPVQQSDPVEHESPPCPQNDEAWHVPFEQKFEQQSPSDAHWLPRVLHLGLSGEQAPLTQLWLQQFPSEVQGAWSDVHAG